MDRQMNRLSSLSPRLFTSSSLIQPDISNDRTYRVRFGQEGALAPLWEIMLTDETLIAGICAGAQGILYQLNSTSSNKYTLTTTIDLSSYRLALDYSTNFIVSSSATLLNDNEYGLWIRGYALYRYSLYRFRDPSFLQGVISICNYFNVDFRNYLFGLPFDKYGNIYTLNGYSLLSYNISQDIREDPYADEEDWDDENEIRRYNSIDDDLYDMREHNVDGALSDPSYYNDFSYA